MASHEVPATGADWDHCLRPEAACASQANDLIDGQHVGERRWRDAALRLTNRARRPAGANPG